MDTKDLLRAAFTLIVPVFLILSGCDLTDSNSSEETLPPTQQALATEWMSMTNEAIKAEEVIPPAAARVEAYAGAAYYEGIRRARPDQYKSLTGQLNGLRTLPSPQEDGPYDWPVVASTAEQLLLSDILRSPSDRTLARIDSLHDEQVQRREESGVTASIIDRSERYGQRLGEALLTWAQQDGAEDIRGLSWEAPDGPGKWEPTRPDPKPAIVPYWSRVRPFATDIGAHQPASPPAYSEDTSSTFYKQMEQAYQTAQQATSEELAIGRYWQDAPGETSTPPGHWVHIARQVAEKQGLKLTETARVFALVGIAGADAFISVWETKFNNAYIRPQTAVRRLADSDWISRINTPPHPEYTSGHSVTSGAQSRILRYAFGGQVAFTDDRVHVDKNFPPRSYDSFREAAEQAGLSRVLGGIHYPISNQRGLEQGRSVAEAIAEKVQLRR